MDFEISRSADGIETVVIRPDTFGNPEHFTPDEARRLAVRLIEMAGRIDSPAICSEWP
jgi:hypothetical protein